MASCADVRSGKLMPGLLIALLFLLTPIFPIKAWATGGEVEISVTYDDSNSGVTACSWFGEPLTLNSYERFGRYTFDGSNVGLELTSSCAKSGFFTVTLLRVSDASTVRIGSASLKSNGFTKATWSNVGPGQYMFEFRSNLGSLITAPTVAMYSW